MGILTGNRPRFAHPRRFEVLRQVRGMDPATEYDDIVRLTMRHDFPWDYLQGAGIAFLRDYGVPDIARLLDRTGEFESDGIKRYDDTLLIGDEALAEGLDSPRGRATVRRLNQIHGHYDIPQHQFAYVLATTIVGPVRWIDEFGYRRLDPVELAAFANFTTRFGELMGLRDLPDTYEGYLQLLASYEHEHFAYDPANQRVTEASIRIAQQTGPWIARPLVPWVVASLADARLREVLGLPRPPRWFTRAVVRVLKVRGWLLRWRPPRTEPKPYHAPTYPHGYSLADLGPRGMLAHLNRGMAGGHEKMAG